MGDFSKGFLMNGTFYYYQ